MTDMTADSCAQLGILGPIDHRVGRPMDAALFEELVHLAVAERPGDNTQAPAPLRQALDRAGKHLTRLPFEASQVSASDIRRRLAQGLPVSGMLNHAVIQYIQRHGLYQVTAS